MKSSAISYKAGRFPQQTVAHAVWLYFRFPLSLRQVEEMLLGAGPSSHMRPSCDGDGNLDLRNMSQSQAANGQRPGTSGIWTRW